MVQKTNAFESRDNIQMGGGQVKKEISLGVPKYDGKSLKMGAQASPRVLD